MLLSLSISKDMNMNIEHKQHSDARISLRIVEHYLFFVAFLRR